MRSSAGHTQEVSLLMNLSDQIQQLNSTLIAVNLPKGKRPPKVHPLPRPIGALEMKRAKAAEQAVDEALSQFGIYD